VIAPLAAGALATVLRLQNDVIAAGLSLDGVMQLVTDRAMEITDADAGVVELVDGDEMVYRTTAGAASGHLGLRLAVETSLSGRCVLEQRVLRCDDALTDPRVNRDACLRVGAISMLCVPLMHGGAAAGVLKVYANRQAAFCDRDVTLLGALSGTIAAHMANAALFERAVHDSNHDALTGLPNRRAYDERLAREVRRVERYGGALSLVVFDLDGFKRVNDRFGHDAGDEALRAFAGVLEGVRDADECFRLGGDEFAIILPLTEAEGARVVGCRVAAATVAGRVGEGHVGASFGVAQLDGHDAAALHREADMALGAAKRSRPVARGTRPPALAAGA
jgi:diguanylate cyclase (GGDEF)-like protein